MPLRDRVTSVGDLRSWTDQIPFRYEYTAGVAGERFLRGLMDGRIVAGECGGCGKRFLPPKAYCTDCFRAIDRFDAVGQDGIVAAMAEAWVGFQGERLARPKRYVFVEFDGVTGGLVHFAVGPGVRVGSRVAPRFRPLSKRRGSLLDLHGFAKK